MNISMHHVYREGNSVADKLAKRGVDVFSEFYLCPSDLPSSVIKALASDGLNLPVWRHAR